MEKMHALELDTNQAANYMTFLFGSFSVFISGNKDFFSYFPESWHRYIVKKWENTAEVKILVQEGFDVEKKVDADGWNYYPFKKGRLVLYSEGGIQRFAIKYGEDLREMTVLVRRFASDIQLGIQFGLLMTLSQRCIGLHGVTLLCGDEIVILSAPSGTGKTTLSHLLEEYCDALVINGDFALLSLSEESVIFEPTPFCGTSRRCLNHRVRVNRVIFLTQALENQWETLSGREATLQFMNNSFIPTWDIQSRQAVENTILECITHLKVNRFSFAPVRKAAEIVYQQCIGEG